MLIPPSLPPSRDALRHHERRAGVKILQESRKRRRQGKSAVGMAKLRSAVEIFTKRAGAFNKTVDQQLNASRLKEDLPWAETVFDLSDGA